MPGTEIVVAATDVDILATCVLDWSELLFLEVLLTTVEVVVLGSLLGSAEDCLLEVGVTLEVVPEGATLELPIVGVGTLGSKRLESELLPTSVLEPEITAVEDTDSVSVLLAL